MQEESPERLFNIHYILPRYAAVKRKEATLADRLPWFLQRFAGGSHKPASLSGALPCSAIANGPEIRVYQGFRVPVEPRTAGGELALAGKLPRPHPIGPEPTNQTGGHALGIEGVGNYFKLPLASGPFLPAIVTDLFRVIRIMRRPPGLYGLQTVLVDERTQFRRHAFDDLEVSRDGSGSVPERH